MTKSAFGPKISLSCHRGCRVEAAEIVRDRTRPHNLIWLGPAEGECFMSHHVSRSLFFQKLKLFLPTLLGTVVEYYDYALYGYCAALLAQHFFPQSDPTVALMQTYGVFAIGSFAKPLGAFVFGRLGDHRGRRVSLRRSLFGIAFPTTIIGLLPSYAEWGWISPLILLGCRFAQGFFVHGEHDGVRLFVLEHVGENRPCFANSLVWIAAFLGIYFASLAAFFVTREPASDWMWRSPFLLAGILGVIVHYLRRFVTETPEFLEYRKNYTQNPQSNEKDKPWIFAKNWQAVAIAVMGCGAVGGGYHFYFVFFGTYLSKTLHFVDAGDASLYTSFAILSYTLTAPLAGLAADYFGLKRTMFVSLGILLILSLLNVFMITQNKISLPLMGMTTIALAFFHSPGYVLWARQFSVGERFRCISMGHALGSMIFSGSTPMICTALWHTTQMPVIPMIYFIGLTIMGFFAVYLGKLPSKARIPETLLYKKSA